MYFEENDYDYKLTECIINGERLIYDSCASGYLLDAKKYYGDNFQYIGSNFGEIYIDGKYQNFKETTHFFIRSNKKLERKRKLKKIKSINEKNI